MPGIPNRITIPTQNRRIDIINKKKKILPNVAFLSEKPPQIKLLFTADLNCSSFAKTVDRTFFIQGLFQYINTAQTNINMANKMIGIILSFNLNGVVKEKIVTPVPPTKITQKVISKE